MPGESSGRLHCTKEGTVGKHIFKAWRPDNHNGLGRRIRTRLVAFFSSSCCGAVKHRPEGGGSFFIPGQRSASSPPKRERERVSIAKGVEIKQRGEISYLCARASEKQPALSYHITLHYLGCLVGADRRIIFSSRKRERKKNQTSKQAHSLLPSRQPLQLETPNEQRPTIYHQHHNERPTTTTRRRRTQQQQQHHHSSRSPHRPL